jgi:hypothetical protein
LFVESLEGELNKIKRELEFYKNMNKINSQKFGFDANASPFDDKIKIQFEEQNEDKNKIELFKEILRNSIPTKFKFLEKQIFNPSDFKTIESLQTFLNYLNQNQSM